jgi:hypothetical protein
VPQPANPAFPGAYQRLTEGATSNLLYINLQDKCEQSWHWSSTQYSAFNAWVQDFSDGGQNIGYKDRKLAARAVRRILIIE